jgi:hypothetical protein
LVFDKVTWNLQAPSNTCILNDKLSSSLHQYQALGTPGANIHGMRGFEAEPGVMPVEQTVEQIMLQPVEQTAEQPEEQTAEQPEEQTVEQTVE